MALIVEEDKDIVKFELTQHDDISDWFLDYYFGTRLDGKTITMDNGMLLSILNSPKCCVVKSLTQPNEDGYDQVVAFEWGRYGDKMTVLIHGRNGIAKRNGRYIMANNAPCSIYFADVQMDPEAQYGKNQKTDTQVVHLTYAAQNFAEHQRAGRGEELDEGMQS